MRRIDIPPHREFQFYFGGVFGDSSTNPVTDLKRPSLEITAKSVPTKCNGASLVPPASHWKRTRSP